MVIIVEGVDASGKTTLCDRLVKKMGGVAYATPPKSFRDERRRRGFIASVEESYAFYRNALIESRREIELLESSHGVVFVDRYWVSTAATHSARGFTVDESSLKYLDCSDLTILLRVSPEEQRKRFGVREMSQSDVELASLSAVIDQAFCRIVRTHCVPHVVIDTSFFSIDDVLNQALDMIVRKQKGALV